MSFFLKLFHHQLHSMINIHNFQKKKGVLFDSVVLNIEEYR